MLQAKQATLAGIKDLDKLIRARNHAEALAAGPAKPKPQAPSSKERAMEYSKNLPRPKVGGLACWVI